MFTVIFENFSQAEAENLEGIARMPRGSVILLPPGVEVKFCIDEVLVLRKIDAASKRRELFP